MYRSPLKAIRRKCLECNCTMSNVRNCPIKQCELYPYRFGKNPFCGLDEEEANKKYESIIKK